MVLTHLDLINHFNLINLDLTNLDLIFLNFINLYFENLNVDSTHLDLLIDTFRVDQFKFDQFDKFGFALSFGTLGKKKKIDKHRLDQYGVSPLSVVIFLSSFLDKFCIVKWREKIHKDWNKDKFDMFAIAPHNQCFPPIVH